MTEGDKARKHFNAMMKSVADAEYSLGRGNWKAVKIWIDNVYSHAEALRQSIEAMDEGLQVASGAVEMVLTTTFSEKD